MFRDNPKWIAQKTELRQVTRVEHGRHHGFPKFPTIFFPVSSSGLLDVGSSYGAWDSLPKSLALDLAPAAPSVWRADFLQLQIEEMEMEEIGT